MKTLTPPTIILFDWHATLVDASEALYHALDDVLPQLEALGLRERNTGKLFSRAWIQAERFAGKPPEALRLVKRLLRAAHAEQTQPSRIRKRDPFMRGPRSTETQYALLAFFTRS